MTTPNVSALKGTGYRQIDLPRMTPEKQALFKQVFSGLQPGLTSGIGHLSHVAEGSPEYFQQMEAPALRQFQELQGNIASRFSGMGSGARRSSGFQNVGTAAASDLSERLASQRMTMQQDAIKQLMGLYRDLMGEQEFESLLIPEEEKRNPWSNFLGGALPIAGALGGGLIGSVVPGFGTLAGAKLGGTIGGAAGKAFL